MLCGYYDIGRHSDEVYCKGDHSISCLVNFKAGDLWWWTITA